MPQGTITPSDQGDVASRTPRSGYAFTDPLRSSDGASTRRQIRRAHALIYGGATPSLLFALLMDGGPVSQRLVTGGAVIATAIMAILALAWRGAPDGFLLAAFPLAALTVTAIAALDPPLALTPMYYVWPLMTAAYFLRRRELLVTYLVVCASFGAASATAIGGPRLIQWVTVAVVGGVVSYFVAALKEALEQRVSTLSALAQEDPLTGALNRRAFVERLDAELARADRSGRPAAVAVVDVDHFKAINDRFGHAAGDAALRRLVDTVSQRLRRGDAVGRLGGEEFAVLLADADADGAQAYAEELRELVSDGADAAGTPFTVSVGVASAAEEPVSAEGLLAAADDALYRAKRGGRDTVRAA
jgi:diguanylate cyclase (GGDEF)-like protein